jgi:hypothetical protein
MTSTAQTSLKWVRVLGDVVDLSLVLGAYTQSKNKKALAGAIALVAAVTAADIFAAVASGEPRLDGRTSILIERTPTEVEHFWNSKKSASCALELEFNPGPTGRNTIVSVAKGTQPRPEIRERLLHLKEWAEKTEVPLQEDSVVRKFERKTPRR